MIERQVPALIAGVEAEHEEAVQRRLAAIKKHRRGAGALDNQKPVINNEALVAEFRDGGGSVLHVRPERLHGDKATWTRGMTLAYVQKGGRIEVATSVTHRSDSFTKKVGTKTAIEHFHAGKTVFLPVRTKKWLVSDLLAAFRCIC